MSLPKDIFDKLHLTQPIIAVTGASGWFGRTTLALLWDVLGESSFNHSVRAFASQKREIQLRPGISVPAEALDRLLDLKIVDYIFHYGFLTRDKVTELGIETYTQLNQKITHIVYQRLIKGDIKGIFCTSSGAVYCPDGSIIIPAIGLNDNPYGALKRQEEILLEQASLQQNTRCLLMRVFSVTGPYMTKPLKYAGFYPSGIEAKCGKN